MNKEYEYFEAEEGYIPVAFIIGSPKSNAYCKGFAKCDWTDNTDSKLYVAWFTGVIGYGLAYIAIWVKE